MYPFPVGLHGAESFAHANDTGAADNAPAGAPCA